MNLKIGIAKFHVKKGYTALAKKHWDKAIAEFDKAIKIYAGESTPWDNRIMDLGRLERQGTSL